MAEFVEGSLLNLRLEELIKEAESHIILISPFIKLHPQIRDLLKSKKEDPNILVSIVFGKNEDDITESLHKADFEFFKEFANIEIRYNPRLHAKYYANENKAILSSMNLHEYSQNNNIEFGVVVDKQGVLALKGRLLNDVLDADAFNFFDDVIESSEVKFIREPRPKLKDKLIKLRKGAYTHSETTIDELSKLFKVSVKIKNGYCIRTGIEIPFDIKMPMSSNGYNQWVDDGRNKLQPELYCHFSGEKSEGANSLAFPVLKKYYRKVAQSNDMNEGK